MWHFCTSTYEHQRGWPNLFPCFMPNSCTSLSIEAKQGIVKYNLCSLVRYIYLFPMKILCWCYWTLIGTRLLALMGHSTVVCGGCSLCIFSTWDHIIYSNTPLPLSQSRWKYPRAQKVIPREGEYHTFCGCFNSILYCNTGWAQRSDLLVPDTYISFECDWTAIILSYAPHLNSCVQWLDEWRVYIT